MHFDPGADVKIPFIYFRCNFDLSPISAVSEIAAIRM